MHDWARGWSLLDDQPVVTTRLFPLNRVIQRATAIVVNGGRRQPRPHAGDAQQVQRRRHARRAAVGIVSGVAAVYNLHAYTDEKRHALDTWAAHVAKLLGKGGDNVMDLTAARAAVHRQS